MTSIERIYEYIALPTEYPKLTKVLDSQLIDWPSTGRIEFQNVSLYYEGPDQCVLKNVNLMIEDREKIGIVGRTGAGKSSLISLLFRLVEIPRDCGKIIVDRQDISTLGLKKLRTSIAVIPQDPVLFMGTIRTNLDPFNEFTDSDVCTVLQTVELMDTINKLPDKLYSPVSEGGSNLSVGQRQLICMARALLKRAKVIVIDEATANVDPHTDSLIQKTLQSTFAHCTVLTIAHRLSTIMNSDRIIVMNNGIVDQFDHPHLLFSDRPDSTFIQLVQQTGPAEEKKLRKMAEKNFLKFKT